MPYIKPADRIRTMDQGCENAGDLAYIIYALVVDWAYRTDGKFSYTKGSAAVGVLETIKHEFTRKHLDPYEDGKLRENSDVDLAECQYVARQVRRKFAPGTDTPQTLGPKQSSGL
jgi:hypothetical protein